MSVVRLSQRAREDLTEVWGYVAQSGPDAADRFTARVLQKCRILADNPGIGRDRSDLLANVRSFSVGAFLIFYRAIPNGIEVVRILSGYQDLPRIFNIPPEE